MPEKSQENNVFKNKIRYDRRCETCGGLHTLQKKISVKIDNKIEEVWWCSECGSRQPS